MIEQGEGDEVLIIAEDGQPAQNMRWSAPPAETNGVSGCQGVMMPGAVRSFPPAATL